MTYIIWAWMTAAGISTWIPFEEAKFNQDDCSIAIHAMGIAHPDVKFQCLPEGEEPK